MIDHGPEVTTLATGATNGHAGPTVGTVTHEGTARYDGLTEVDGVPPLDYEGAVDDLRVRLFEHPHLLTTEVTVADGFAVQLGRLRPM